MLGRLIDSVIAAVAPLRAVRRAQARAALAAYASAEKNRKNRDWKAVNRSADAAIIADTATLNARARAEIRDSHIAKAIELSKVRNIVGRGITPIPVATDPGGGELAALNKVVERKFMRWADKPDRCDVEGRRTFWQFQQLCIREMNAVGQAFLVWSLHPDHGFRLQAYEAEQLYDVIQDYQGNEVRRGIELDVDGRAVAYHFYLRNPNDYLFRRTLQPVRIPRENVLHFFDPERVRQTHGVTELAPVLQRIRDVHSRDDAELQTARMEACLGMAIVRNGPVPLGDAPGVAAESGESATTAGGMRKFDFAPGMIAELEPGEDVKFFAPTRPGNGYEPFTKQHLRSIGAGTGSSYEQINRDFSQGTYSSQRQGLIEDRREWFPKQDLLTDQIVCPSYELWYRFAVIRGELPLLPAAYAVDPDRYLEAEYVPDGHDWIDPKAEAEAAEKMLTLRLATRKEYIGGRGGRWTKVFEQSKAERERAAALGITFPEDAPAAPPGGGFGGPPGKPAMGGPPKPGMPPAPGAPPAAPGTPGDPDAAEGAAVVADVATDATLNGAQIKSTIDVIERLYAGSIAPTVAVELLVSAGIPRDKAAAMVEDTGVAPPEPPGAAGLRRLPHPPAAGARAKAVATLAEWITKNGGHIKISDDGEIRSGKNAGYKIGGGGGKGGAKRARGGDPPETHEYWSKEAERLADESAVEDDPEKSQQLLDRAIAAREKADELKGAGGDKPTAPARLPTNADDQETLERHGAKVPADMWKTGAVGVAVEAEKYRPRTGPVPDGRALDRSVEAAVDKLKTEHADGLIPIHKIRQAVADEHGADAARHDVLDDHILGLWRNNRERRLLSLSDGRMASPDESAGGILSGRSHPDHFVQLADSELAAG